MIGNDHVLATRIIGAHGISTSILFWAAQYCFLINLWLVVPSISRFAIVHREPVERELRSAKLKAEKGGVG